MPPSAADSEDLTATARWVVKRQDDNGHVFEIARFSSSLEAEAVAAEYEARGHKQMYWVELAGRP